MNEGKSGNSTLAIVGLVLAIVAILCSFIPCLGMFAILPGIISLVLGAISYFQAKDSGSPKTMPTAVIVISVIACALSIYQIYKISNMASDLKGDVKTYDNCDDLLADMAALTKELDEMESEMENKDEAGEAISGISAMMGRTIKLGILADQGEKLGCDMEKMGEMMEQIGKDGENEIGDTQEEGSENVNIEGSEEENN